MGQEQLWIKTQKRVTGVRGPTGHKCEAHTDQRKESAVSGMAFTVSAQVWCCCHTAFSRELQRNDQPDIV